MRQKDREREKERNSETVSESVSEFATPVAFADRAILASAHISIKVRHAVGNYVMRLLKLHDLNARCDDGILFG